jgi:hypothetical protein
MDRKRRRCIETRLPMCVRFPGSGDSFEARFAGSKVSD